MKRRKTTRPLGAGKKPTPLRSQDLTQVRLREAPGQGWELVHPRCAAERADDMAEVQAMLAAGELDIARDELRWLLDGCSDFLECHKLLGELAYADHDVPLARGHFGYAFRIGEKAIAAAGEPRPAPYALPGNQAFFEAGKALVLCLLELGKRETAAEVAQKIVSYDPADPLAIRPLLVSNDGHQH